MEAYGVVGCLAALAVSGLVFNLFRLGYYLAGISLFRHPLFAGILAWLITQDINLLLAALFFELFWLDLFNVGTYVPPDSVFAYLVFAPLAYALGLQGAEQMSLFLLCCLPLAGLSAKIEQFIRQRHTRDYHVLNKVINEGGEISAVMDSIAWCGLWRMAIISNLMLGLCFLYLLGLAWLSIRFFGSVYSIPWADWHFLLCFAAAGGLLALRIPQAMVCFIACVTVVGAVFIFGF